MARKQHEKNCIHCKRYHRSIRCVRSMQGEEMFYVKCRCGAGTDTYFSREEAWEAWDEGRIIPPLWWN